MTITNGQPVALWPLIDRLLADAGSPRQRPAHPAAGGPGGCPASGRAWRLLRLPGEPPATRYSVALLGYSQTFEGRGREALGYAPLVRWRRGWPRTLAWLHSEEGGAERGYHTAPEWIEPDTAALVTGTACADTGTHGRGGGGDMIGPVCL